MNALRRKQLIGFAGAMAALLLLALVYACVPKLFSRVTLPTDDAASRLAFALRWLLVPGFTLLAGVCAASRRGFYADAIDGTRSPGNYGLEINLRYNTNTLEQVVLAAIAWSALAVELQRDALLFIPAMASTFAVGRVTFWIGYVFHPMARTFGMAMTAVPTILAYGWLAGRAIGVF